MLSLKKGLHWIDFHMQAEGQVNQLPIFNIMRDYNRIREFNLLYL